MNLWRDIPSGEKLPSFVNVIDAIELYKENILKVDKLIYSKS